MKRRNVLKGIAAGSAMSMGIAGATSRRDVRVDDISRYDKVFLKEGDRVVKTVENPTWDDVKRLNSEATDSQTVVNPDDDCTEYCCDQCTCSTCMCGCNNCCDPENEVCSDC